MQRAADLHIHSCFSMASSPRMLPDEIIAGCQVKGISIIGTGDILHPEWREMWQKTLIPEDILVLPTTEVEGIGRVHHLIILPDFEAVKVLSDLFSPHSRNITSNGRPRVNLTGEEILSFVHESGGIGGPAHAFTPYTSVYSAFDNLSSCFGDETVDLLELGLSADSSYGAGISELSAVPFLTNSDAHSPEPSKLGRECTILDLTRDDEEGAFKAVKEGKIQMNIGFFPEEGKYNRTACCRCFTHYSLEDAAGFSWKCPHDGGRIKKGVRDLALSLSSASISSRPPYLHIIPLSEIIQRVLGVKSPNTRRCKDLYTCCIQHFGDEISVLTRVDISDICAVHPPLANAVEAFRNGQIILHPGGGGQYGSFEIPVM